MRAPLLLALVLLGTAPAWAAEEPSGCDKFKWPIERERAALTAPDRIKLASGGELAALPSTGITLGLQPPAEAKLPTPPERAPKEGTFAGFANFKTAPKPGNLHHQPVRGRMGRPGPGRPCPEAKGFQRRHRLRRHSQDHEVRDFGKPVRAPDHQRQGRCRVGGDPAVGIDRRDDIPARDRTQNRFPVLPIALREAFTQTPSLLLFLLAISRSTVSHRDPWNDASTCRVHVQPTPVLRARCAANTHGSDPCIV